MITHIFDDFLAPTFRTENEKALIDAILLRKTENLPQGFAFYASLSHGSFAMSALD